MNKGKANNATLKPSVCRSWEAPGDEAFIGQNPGDHGASGEWGSPREKH